MGKNISFEEVLIKRQSVRKFQDKPVSFDLIKQIIELAKLAPSAGNLQAFKVIITEERLSSINAPVCLVICACPEVSAHKYGDRGRILYSIQDATIFGAYVQLVSVYFGLSSVWVGAFRKDRIVERLNINDGLIPIALIFVGYDMEIPKRTRRRSFEEIVCWANA